MDTNNCYQVLNCDEDASKELLKTNYKKMALELHPDKSSLRDTCDQSSSKKLAEDKFKLVTRAYKTLSDDEERRKHDAELTFHRTDSLLMGEEVDISDFSSEEGLLAYSCRCGSSYILDPAEVAREEIVSLPCSGCSLHIIVKTKKAENV